LYDILILYIQSNFIYHRSSAPAIGAAIPDSPLDDVDHAFGSDVTRHPKFIEDKFHFRGRNLVGRPNVVENTLKALDQNNLLIALLGSANNFLLEARRHFSRVAVGSSRKWNMGM
jgi:hypothetical protein